MALDTATGLYYVDFDATCTSVGTNGNIADESTLTIISATGTYFAEGFSVYALESELAFSTKERVQLQLSRYINDDKDLRDVSTAYAVRVNYAYAEDYDALQDYVEDVDNRPVGEDILIRHMLPSLVILDITTDLQADDAETASVDYFLAKDPTESFELSDLVEELYQAGAEYVKMPLTATVLDSSRNRKWTATHVSDMHTTARASHYIADTTSVTATES